MGSSRFYTADWPYTLEWAASFPQNCPFPWGNVDPDLTHGSFGQPKPITQTASQSVHLFFAGLKTVTDRPTDRPCYSVCNNRPHLAYVAMRPNNNNNNNASYNVHCTVSRKFRLRGGGSCQVERDGLCYWVANWLRKWDLSRCSKVVAAAEALIVAGISFHILNEQ